MSVAEAERCMRRLARGGRGREGGRCGGHLTAGPSPPKAELEAEASVSAEGLTLRGSPPSDRLSEFLRRVGAATTALEH